VPPSREIIKELNQLDAAVYSAVARTNTPVLDRAFASLSRAADNSKLWLGSAAALGLAGGTRGRRAAARGLCSLALTSAVVNLFLKPLSGRRRPERAKYRLPIGRWVKMPRTRSFPSGHAASAFAFAGGVASADPLAGFGLTTTAALVGYSRVHVGVHYPGDVIAGAVVGLAMAPLGVVAADRLYAAASRPATPAAGSQSSAAD
jgi:membrane-associated phospholipid phosphatase